MAKENLKEQNNLLMQQLEEYALKTSLRDEGEFRFQMLRLLSSMNQQLFDLNKNLKKDEQ